MSNMKIPQSAKVRVHWDDRPENYTRESKNKVRNYFAKKYGIDKNNINVIYRPIKFNEQGDVIEITGAGIENIMDKTYQRSLMQEWIKREGKNVNFERILKLDDKVNAELPPDTSDNKYRQWAIKWLSINNFLCFGENVYVPFNRLNGLVVVNSVPSNTGGKTTLTIDAVKFMLYGNTTKTDKNEEIFNQYSNNNELVVRGMINLEGDEVIIERKMKRTAKRGGGWTITNKVNYYEILPDGEEKELNEEDAKVTTTKLRNTIGSEKDFEMLCLATEKNLDDLIGFTSSESGKIITRLIGLEVVETKEGIVRKMYNEFDKKKKSNLYDVVTLTDEIEDHNQKILLSQDIETQLIEKFENAKLEINKLNDENDRLLNSKTQIDVQLETLDPTKLESDVETLTKKGINLKNNVAELNKNISDIGEVIFDEDKYNGLAKSLSTYQQSKAVLTNQLSTINRTIKGLIDGGICQECNRPLDNIDNSEHIKTHTNTKNLIETDLLATNKIISEIENDIELLSVNKTSLDKKNRLELDRDRLEVEMGSLRNQLISKKNDLSKYNLNLKVIEFNKQIDIDVSLVKTKINVANHTKDDSANKIERIKNEIINHRINIDDKTKLITQIKSEDEVEKIYKIYIEMFGKKGIGKLVLRSVLPIINSELHRLLDETCDFDIEIAIDDKNDVQFNLIKDDVSKLLKSGSGLEKTASSLALRCVLGKLSTLPMPNFITFDEVMGKVSNENIERLKPLFDKIKDMYEIVFLITHNDLVKDWATVNITVIKNDNISTVDIK